MKKKVIFSMYNLDIGGIETALINILKNFDYDKYDVTLFLEKKEGIFIEEIPNPVKVISYDLCDSKNIIYRKIKNRLKLIYYIVKFYKKYDCGICYASHRRVGAKLIPFVSKKNILWVHGNYWNDSKSFNKFLYDFNVKKYKNIVFVSNSLKTKFLKFNKSISNQNLYSLNNIIDYKNILNLAEQEKIIKNKITFLNVGRHTEEEKNLSMLINVVKKLIDNNYDFELLLIGDGPDHEYYKKMVNDLKLSKNIKFLGKKKNPFPYYKIADALLLTSKHEGNPVVFLESKLFNMPIITTNVSDAKTEIDQKYGIVSDNNFNSYYNNLKKFLDHGFEIKEKFNYKEYNESTLKNIYEIIDKG